jgi:Zn-dependent protease
MDGGRVLRALLAKRKGYVDATRIAVTVARVCSVGMGILGVVTHGWMLVALAILVWSMGTRELRSVT